MPALCQFGCVQQFAVSHVTVKDIVSCDAVALVKLMSNWCPGADTRGFWGCGVG